MLKYVGLGSTLHTVLPNFGYFITKPNVVTCKKMAHFDKSEMAFFRKVKVGNTFCKS